MSLVDVSGSLTPVEHAAAGVINTLDLQKSLVAVLVDLGSRLMSQVSSRA